MKALYQKLVSKLQLWLYKRNPHKTSGLGDLMFQIRIAQAFANIGKTVLWLGDSRIHACEPLVNALPGHIDLGVSGSKIGDGLKYGKQIAGIVVPRAIVEDWCGNDFLAGHSLDDVFSAKLLLRDKLKSVCQNVLSMELCPLGPGNEETNKKIAEYNARCLKAFPQDIVFLNDLMAPDGTMLPIYDSGDGVHWSVSAYTTVVIPRTVQTLAVRGIV